MRPSAVGLFLLVALSAAWGADVVVGGEGVAEAGLMLDTGDLAGTDLDWRLSFDPRLSVSASALSLAVQARLRWEGGDETPALGLRKLELRWEPADAVGARVGRFAYLPGAAELGSPLNFFGRLSLEALVAGGDSYLPLDLVQLALYYRSVFLRLTASPVPAPPLIPDFSSPWFPRRDFPASITVTVPSQQVMVLDEIRWQEDPSSTTPEGLRGVSASAELGLTLDPLDVTLLYYHGNDNSPLLTARLVFPQGLYKSFDVEVALLWRTIDALGLSTALGAGAFRAWADASLVFSRTFLTKRLDVATFETQTVKAPSVLWAGGVSVEPGFADLLLLAEWKGFWTSLPAEEYVPPLLGSLVGATASLGLWDGRLSLVVSLLSSTEDWSTALSFLATWRPEPELSLELSAPFFLGAADTELGQFAGNHALWLRLIWRV